MDQTWSNYIATPITNWLGDRHKDFQRFVSQHHPVHESTHTQKKNKEDIQQHMQMQISQPISQQIPQPISEQITQPMQNPQYMSRQNPHHFQNVNQTPEFLKLINLLMQDNLLGNRTNIPLYKKTEREIQNFILDFKGKTHFSDEESKFVSQGIQNKNIRWNFLYYKKQEWEVKYIKQLLKNKVIDLKSYGKTDRKSVV